MYNSINKKKVILKIKLLRLAKRTGRNDQIWSDNVSNRRSAVGSSVIPFLPFSMKTLHHDCPDKKTNVTVT